MTDPVGVVSVGLGWWGGRLAEAAKEAGLEFVSCFARTAEAREAFAQSHGWRPASGFEVVLGDPDVKAIMLATPHTTHAAQIEAAAAGKHVFVENR